MFLFPTILTQIERQHKNYFNNVLLPVVSSRVNIFASIIHQRVFVKSLIIACEISLARCSIKHKVPTNVHVVLCIMGSKENLIASGALMISLWVIKNHLHSTLIKKTGKTLFDIFTVELWKPTLIISMQT